MSSLQVVQLQPAVLEEFQQFPVAGADRAGRRRAPRAAAGAEVAGEMPEERIAAPLRLAAAGEQAEVARAVERIAGVGFRAGEFEERRIEIHAVDRLVADGAGRDTAGPAEDVRHADAAFVEHALAAAQRCVVGDAAALDAFALVAADAAVVAGEDHERVVAELEFVEHGQHAADAFVHAGDHGGISRDRGGRRPAAWV